jgi:hypothetical protein
MEDKMELIERYLFETGRHLPRKNREDILAEIRSFLEDKLDESAAGKPTEDDVVKLLQETGSPQKMAASYAPEGQYVIGPSFYPIFRLVTTIALAATLGAQLLAWFITLWSGNTIQAADLVSSLLISVPTTIGWVVIIFMVLQRAGVQPKLEEKWNPRNLPAIDNHEEVKRSDTIFGIAASSLFLALLVVMPEKIGIYSGMGGEFFANPVILQTLPWIYASLALCIAFNIFLLWRGRWDVASRAVELGVDVFSIVVLTMLYKGHSAWLTAHGSNGFVFHLQDLAGDITSNLQLFGMKVFCLAFGIALIVIVAVSISKLVRMIVKSLRAGK